MPKRNVKKAAKDTRRRTADAPTKATARPPAKPYRDFPLFAHASGQWAKKIRGKMHYFGVWADPAAAIDNYLRRRDYLYAGTTPPPTVDGVTLDELVNRFLASQRDRRDGGEITQRHYADYERDGKRMLDALGRERPAAGLMPGDFARLRAATSEGRNATTVSNMIIRMRAVFRWGHATRLLADPIDYGEQFRQPTARAKRLALRQRGRRAATADEVRAILSATGDSVNLRAMIYLGINAGLGNSDCAGLKFDHLDLKAGLLDYPRDKTGVQRRAALWPETLDALAAAIERRGRMRDIPDELAGNVFVTLGRQRYVRDRDNGTRIDSVGLAFRRRVEAAGCKRPGLGFYALRHAFRTVADETRDFPAVDLVMGHAAADVAGAPFAVQMADRYRDHISNERLGEVAEYVRAWLAG